MPTLFDPFNLRGLTLKHRVAMAPLTRCRADAEGVPQPISQTYYAQRASAGLIITEATNITSKSCSFERAPGIYSAAQVEGWKPIIEAVHKNGGSIFVQLWHFGGGGTVAGLKRRGPPFSARGEDGVDLLHVCGVVGEDR